MQGYGDDEGKRCLLKSNKLLQGKFQLDTWKYFTVTFSNFSNTLNSIVICYLHLGFHLVAWVILTSVFCKIQGQKWSLTVNN